MKFIVLRPKSHLPAEFAYLATRTVRPAASLDQFVVAVPSAEGARACGKVACTIMNTMKAKDEESRTLAAIRDALLSRQISGELRVDEAERMVEDAVLDQATH